jgi:hypothetical protein
VFGIGFLFFIKSRFSFSLYEIIIFSKLTSKSFDSLCCNRHLTTIDLEIRKVMRLCSDETETDFFLVRFGVERFHGRTRSWSDRKLFVEIDEMRILICYINENFCKVKLESYS